MPVMINPDDHPFKNLSMARVTRGVFGMLTVINRWRDRAVRHEAGGP